MDDLTRLLYTGLVDTMSAAKSASSLLPPYGRPKPLTIEDIEEKINESSSDEDSDPDSDAGEDEEEDTDEEIEFEYKYGFNPLVHLGMYLKRNNPRNVLIRAARKEEAREFLKKRSQHSLRQMSTQEEIYSMSSKMMTGLSLGPAISVAGEGKAKIWAGVARQGRIVVEVGKNEEMSGGQQAESIVGAERDGDPISGVVEVRRAITKSLPSVATR